MLVSRRSFLRTCAVTAGAFGIPFAGYAQANTGRTFHASLSIDALEADPELIGTVRDAGVSAIWLSCFYNGQWHRDLDTLRLWADRVRDAGLDARRITIPLGHPSFTEAQPDYMPQVDHMSWQRGRRPDGTLYRGVTLHPPATEVNVDALRQIKTADPGIIFVDDDFRLAPSPNDIGGCFCDVHKAAFLAKHGYGEPEWAALLADVAARKLTPVVRAWVEDTCDELTACFRAQQAAAAPEAQLGIMVMFLGCEKAGIRLSDYRDVPARVGELMFDDGSFGRLKGKTDELFSALFHRRFFAPELAYSETTAWPSDKLSAPNMAAKLVISTIADVRNTMFMSGLTPFPRTHWATLAPAMAEQKRIHSELAGHTPKGPFRHYWGEGSRFVGDANPYSLFLALGVPFEVVEAAPAEGWVFLADADAGDAAGIRRGGGAQVVCRPGLAGGLEGVREVAEDLTPLFALRREILPSLGRVPYVEQETPVVCAWYPSRSAVLLWNLTETAQEVTLRCGEATRAASLGPLGSALLTDIRV